MCIFAASCSTDLQDAESHPTPSNLHGVAPPRPPKIGCTVWHHQELGKTTRRTMCSKSRQAYMEAVAVAHATEALLAARVR